MAQPTVAEVANKTTRLTQTESELEESNERAPLLPALREHDLSVTAITLGAGIDPDGIASQMAMVAIVKKINPDAKVYCFGRGDWDRPQNKTMRELLGVDPRPYEEATNPNRETPAPEEFKYTCIISVDGPPGVCFADPDFVIDHHKQNKEIDKSDVRFIGSCSAIMWEYCVEAGIDFTTEAGSKLATALLIGIDTDTLYMEVDTTSDLDWEAHAACGKLRDKKLYLGIRNYPKPKYYKDLEMKAWDAKAIENNVLVTQLGVLPKERKGVVSTCSAEFVGYGGVTTTVVFAFVDGKIHFSVRSFNTSLNVDAFIKKIMEHGGGAPGKGAGDIPIPSALTGSELPEKLQLDMFMTAFEALKHKVLKYLGDGVRANGE